MRTSPDEYLNGEHRYSSHHSGFSHRPGKGRRPGGKAPATAGYLSSFSSPEWAPALAGVVSMCGGMAA